MDVFESCHKVNDLLNQSSFVEARNKLIQLLDFLGREELDYPELVNHLIRQTGLFPYIQPETASWQDRFIYESFKVDVGDKEPITLHRDQSMLLKKLLDGESLAVSAPTSFGKSFVVDSFISIRKPKNVVIIVPTIALTDETRRRMQRKFAGDYKIITTTDVELAEKNILIFPQERAISYVSQIKELDILIVDEFYKASPKFDRERSPALLRAILHLAEKAKQRYFLAPNISDLDDNQFTKGMTFLKLDFNTVYLKRHNLFKDIQGDETLKSKALIEILNKNRGKTLIYAGTYSSIEKVSQLVIENFSPTTSKRLLQFQEWLKKNYDPNWNLPSLVKRGFGIHNGQLHRSLSQIQVKLFEEHDGLDRLISTSSIIEGVNTSSENVVIWLNKKGRSRLDDFTYKNIIGRGGRMFKHFIGQIFVLEPPPPDGATQLTLEFPDELICEVDQYHPKPELTKEQLAKIIAYKEEMGGIIGSERFQEIQEEEQFQNGDSNLILDISRSISRNPEIWSNLSSLNSENPSYWDNMLYRIIKFRPGNWGIEHNKFVSFIKILSGNWKNSIPELLKKLDEQDIGVNDFFKLERVVTFDLAALLNDINMIQKEIIKSRRIDISPFITKCAHAFLPRNVFQLEEYGLPRMISKKIQSYNLIDLSDHETPLHQIISNIKRIGKEEIFEKVTTLDNFDKYIINFFFEGIFDQTIKQ